MEKFKKQIVYAFIDSQNLNFGTSKDLYNKAGKKIYDGWNLDFRKFRRYLSDKFRVKKALLFIGYLEQYEEMYKNLRAYGYELIFKPTVKDAQGKPKGNVDAELVLYSAAIEFSHYEKAVVVSGDGDFYCLHDYLLKNNKLLSIVIPNRKSESSLLNKFQVYKTFLIRDKEKVELKHKNGRRST